MKVQQDFIIATGVTTLNVGKHTKDHYTQSQEI